MTSDEWQLLLRADLARRDGAHLLRTRRELTPIDSVHVELDGKRYVNFASNNYLGLTHHPAVLRAMKEAIDLGGAGAGAAGLITGFTAAHADADRAIAEWK